MVNTRGANAFSEASSGVVSDVDLACQAIYFKIVLSCKAEEGIGALALSN